MYTYKPARKISSENRVVSTPHYAELIAARWVKTRGLTTPFAGFFLNPDGA
jgi:hypothetical protein